MVRAAGSLPESVAVIDVGSNSGRVVVYAREAAGHLRILASARASLRLVEELDDRGRLGYRGIERAMEALRDFHAIARGAGARRVVALATAAAREAADGALFIARVRRELGIRVQILDSAAEARFGFLGAVRGLPVESGLLFDMGGGSMQVTHFRARRAVRSFGLRLGSLRLSHHFLLTDPPTRAEVRRLREHVLAQLDEAGVPRLRAGEVFAGTGGSVRNLAKMHRHGRPYPITRLHGYELSRGGVRDIAEALVSRRARKRERLPGLNQDRGDSIAGGACGILALMEHVGAERVLVSGQGVREGIAYGIDGADLPSVPDVRDASVRALGRRFAGFDAHSAERRAGLARALGAGLLPRGAAELREALAHAATLLDVGRSVDYFDRYEHAADILLATELDGFTHREVALVSAITRSGDADASPRPMQPLVAAADREAVERAGVLLALADDLEHRCPRGQRLHATVENVPGRSRVRVRELAGWRPRGLAGRFAAAFGRELEVAAR